AAQAYALRDNQKKMQEKPDNAARCAASGRKNKNAGQHGALRSTATRVAPEPATSEENAILSKEEIK
ncbi:hypothetical protein A2U01_0063257, partial [Trifolium medium]|nr:hypothetical protein [Trifolium medium]